MTSTGSDPSFETTTQSLTIPELAAAGGTPDAEGVLVVRSELTFEVNDEEQTTVQYLAERNGDLYSVSTFETDDPDIFIPALVSIVAG